MSEKITTDKQDTRLSLEQHIARALKRKRISQGYKISDVARIAELSQGMISKVENAQVSASAMPLTCRYPNFSAILILEGVVPSTSRLAKAWKLCALVRKLATPISY